MICRFILDVEAPKDIDDVVDIDWAFSYYSMAIGLVGEDATSDEIMSKYMELV